MEEKTIKEIDQVLDLLRNSPRKYGEIILIVKNGQIRFIDLRCSSEIVKEFSAKKSS